MFVDLCILSTLIACYVSYPVLLPRISLCSYFTNNAKSEVSKLQSLNIFGALKIMQPLNLKTKLYILINYYLLFHIVDLYSNSK